MLDGGEAPLSELPVGSNQKTNIEEVATLLQTPPVGSNQKTVIEEVATLLQTPPVGSN